MSFKFLPIADNFNSIGKTIRAALLIALIAVCALAADVWNRRGDVNCKLNVAFYQKTAEGVWKVIDRIEAQCFLQAGIRELAGGTSFKTDYVWQGRTAEGRAITVRMAQAAPSQFDPHTGRFSADVVYDITLDGHKLRTPVTLTTESVFGPGGAISGQRATINGQTGRLAMVGLGRTRIPGTGVNKLSGEFTVVIKGEGDVTIN